MKAIRVHQPGAAEVLQLEKIPTPAPRQGWVRAKHRAWIALGVALAAGGVVITDALHNPTGATDNDQLRHAARALRHALDP
jgi:NADPH:quinone reductase-like Zn-dependent oxidoreductase